ncbi:MAG: DUF370 domain-containing protein [Oscillospiraceae bacterium]|nr:DUF370 domain-containing protein [Oscillospiraceae bacterium]
MYINIGGDMAVRAETIVGVFDLDNTSWSHRTRAFLQRAEKDGSVISVSDELPKSFVLVREMGLERVYLTQFSAATLEKRIADPESR